MDKKYLEEQMSAYLDGELSPNEMAKYEQEIQSYPELFAELQTLQRLNKLAKSSQMRLPDEKYFENLAGRIDESVANQPAGQSRIVEFFLARRKTVAIISSVAAVLLVVLIGMNMFGPTAKKYPNELPAYKAVPQEMIIRNQRVDTAAAGTTVDLLAVPDKDLSGDVKSQEIVVSDEPKLEIASPVPETSSVSMVQPKSESATPADSRDAMKVPMSAIIKPGQLKKKNLSDESSGAVSNSLSGLEEMSSQIATVPSLAADTIIIFTETIFPGLGESTNDALSNSADIASRPDLSRFHDSGNLSWSVYRDVFNELEQGMYRGMKLSALTRSLDSLQAWKDSIKVLGPARWYAEQAFRSLQAKEITWDEYQRMRAYIDHYMAETQIPDSAVGNRRLPIVYAIYERQLRKPSREKK